MTQNEKILDIMDREGQITKLRAMHAGIMCLTSRIDELRKAGADIVTERRRVTNADGSTSVIGVYRRA
jgi:phage host-nuclease inhibitor protein Gam